MIYFITFIKCCIILRIIFFSLSFFKCNWAKIRYQITHYVQLSWNADTAILKSSLLNKAKMEKSICTKVSHAFLKWKSFRPKLRLCFWRSQKNCGRLKRWSGPSIISKSCWLILKLDFTLMRWKNEIEIAQNRQSDYHKLFDIELKMLWLNGCVKSLNDFDYESDFWKWHMDWITAFAFSECEHWTVIHWTIVEVARKFLSMIAINKGT